MIDFSPMDRDSAVSVLYSAQDDFPAVEDVKRVIEAGLTLEQQLAQAEKKLEYSEARRGVHIDARRAKAETEGGTLTLGADVGGPRHFLSGRPVHAGSRLYLLTSLGWMPGRYEWGYDASTLARFYFHIPGAYETVAIRIDSGMCLAWPDEVAR